MWIYIANNCTLTIYKSKFNKKVFLLCLKHKSVTVKQSNKCLPENNKLYSSTKFKIHITDQMAWVIVKCKFCRLHKYIFCTLIWLKCMGFIQKKKELLKIFYVKIVFILVKRIVSSRKNVHNIHQYQVKLLPYLMGKKIGK